MAAKSPSSLTNLASLLTICHRQISTKLSAELKSCGLSFDMWLVLGLLNEKAGRTMTEIADALALNLPTATKLIDRMVSDNLVYRRSHNRDRRRVIIFATEQGLTLFSEAQHISSQFENRLVENIENADQLRKQLSTLSGNEM